jgi:hypothetical protein
LCESFRRRDRVCASPPRGSLAGQIRIGEDFELGDEQVDAMLDDGE